MRGSSECQSFRDRFLDADKLKPAICNDITEDSRQDDADDRHRHDPAGFLRYAHSNGCCNGLGKQGNIVDMFQTEDHGHHIDADDTSDDSGCDRCCDCCQVLL